MKVMLFYSLLISIPVLAMYDNMNLDELFKLKVSNQILGKYDKLKLGEFIKADKKIEVSKILSFEDKQEQSITLNLKNGKKVEVKYLSLPEHYNHLEKLVGKKVNTSYIRYHKLLGWVLSLEGKLFDISNDSSGVFEKEVFNAEVANCIEKLGFSEKNAERCNNKLFNIFLERVKYLETQVLSSGEMKDKKLYKNWLFRLKQASIDRLRILGRGYLTSGSEYTFSWIDKKISMIKNLIHTLENDYFYYTRYEVLHAELKSSKNDSYKNSRVGPGFDCAKAKLKVETLICENQRLSQLDSDMSKLYVRLMQANPSIKKSQKKWIKQRNKCKEKVCLFNLYFKRFLYLSSKEWES